MRHPAWRSAGLFECGIFAEAGRWLRVEYAGALDESCAGAFGVQVGADCLCGGSGGHLDVFVGGERIVGQRSTRSPSPNAWVAVHFSWSRGREVDPQTLGELAQLFVGTAGAEELDQFLLAWLTECETVRGEGFS